MNANYENARKRMREAAKQIERCASKLLETNNVDEKLAFSMLADAAQARLTIAISDMLIHADISGEQLDKILMDIYEDREPI